MGLPKLPNRTPQELTQKKQQELYVESLKRFTGKSGKTRYAVQARTRSDLDQQGPTDFLATNYQEGQSYQVIDEPSAQNIFKFNPDFQLPALSEVEKGPVQIANKRDNLVFNAKVSPARRNEGTTFDQRTIQPSQYPQFNYQQNDNDYLHRQVLADNQQFVGVQQPVSHATLSRFQDPVQPAKSLSPSEQKLQADTSAMGEQMMEDSYQKRVKSGEIDPNMPIDELLNTDDDPEPNSLLDSHHFHEREKDDEPVKSPYEQSSAFETSQDANDVVALGIEKAIAYRIHAQNEGDLVSQASPYDIMHENQLRLMEPQKRLEEPQKRLMAPQEDSAGPRNKALDLYDLSKVPAGTYSIDPREVASDANKYEALHNNPDFDEKEFMESFAKQGEIGVTKGSPDLTAYQQQNYGLTTGKQATQEMDSELEM